MILTLLLLTAFTLITLDYRSGGGGPLRRIGNAVFGPIEDAGASVARPIASFFSGLGHLSSYKRDNAKLRKDLAAEREKNRLSQLDRNRLADMEKLLHLDQAAKWTTVTARVIAAGSGLGFESTATIDVGSQDGIEPDETVVSGDGLVGKTLSVGPTTSTILLGNDVNFHAGSRLERTEEIGHVDGGGRRPMTFTLLDAQGSMKVGDRLVTFGDINNRPFVPEVPIGHITQILPANGALTRTAVIAPYVRFSTLDVVSVVIAATERVRRDSLLPSELPTPRASTSPSPTPSRTP